MTDSQEEVSDQPVVSEVTRQLIERDARGRAKYGTTLDRTDLDLADWLQHMAEELLDAAGYALAAKREAGRVPDAAHGIEKTNHHEPHWTTQRGEDLEPCPFCGTGRPWIVPQGDPPATAKVVCGNPACLAEVESADAQQAVAKWNRRVAPKA